MDFKILRYIQPAYVTPMQCAEDLHKKFCKVADIYGESPLNNTFGKGIDFSICHRSREYWARHPQAVVTDITFKAQLLLAVQKSGSQTSQHQQSSSIQKTVRSAYLQQAFGSFNCDWIITLTNMFVPTLLEISSSSCYHTPAAPHTKLDTPSLSLKIP